MGTVDGAKHVSTLTTNGYPGLQHSLAVFRLPVLHAVTLALPLLVSLHVPAAEAAPVYLPPQNVNWNQTGPNTVELTWEPPLDADKATTYNIYRDDELLGRTPATSFVGNFTGPTLFRITAVHHTDSSASFQTTYPVGRIASVESTPAWVVVGILPCSPILVSTYPGPPYVAYSINPNCIT